MFDAAKPDFIHRDFVARDDHLHGPRRHVLPRPPPAGRPVARAPLRPARAALPRPAQLRHRPARRRDRAPRRRPAVPQHAGRPDLVVRRAAGGRRTGSRTCSSRTSGSSPATGCCCAGPTTSGSSRCLVRRAQGRRGRWSPRCPCCAPASCRPSTRSPTLDAALVDHRFLDAVEPARRPRRSRFGDDASGARGAPSPRRSTTSPPPATTSRCSRSPPARPGGRRRRCTSTATCSPSATRSRRTCCSRRPTTSSPARRRSPSRSGSAACCSSRCTPAPRRCWSRRRRRPELADLIDEHGVTVCFTAPTAYKAMLRARGKRPCATLRKAVSAGEHLPEGDLGGVPRRHRRRDHRRHRRDRDAAHLHLRRRARHPARLDRPRGPGLSPRRVVDDDGHELPPGRPGGWR